MQWRRCGSSDSDAVVPTYIYLHIYTNVQVEMEVSSGPQTSRVVSAC